MCVMQECSVCRAGTCAHEHQTQCWVCMNNTVCREMSCARAGASARVHETKCWVCRNNTVLCMKCLVWRARNTLLAGMRPHARRVRNALPVVHEVSYVSGRIRPGLSCIRHNSCGVSDTVRVVREAQCLLCLRRSACWHETHGLACGNALCGVQEAHFLLCTKRPGCRA